MSSLNPETSIGNLDELRDEIGWTNFLDNFYSDVLTCGLPPMSEKLSAKMKQQARIIEVKTEELETKMLIDFIDGLAPEEIREWKDVIEHILAAIRERENCGADSARKCCESLKKFRENDWNQAVNYIREQQAVRNK